MSRPKKKTSNPALSMKQLINKAVSLFEEPYDDRDERESSLPSLRSVADELNTTILRARKLLITAEYFSTDMSRTVQEMTAEGLPVAEIMAATGLKKASINSYLPYKNLAFNLDQTTVNADRHKLFRRRVKAVEELKKHMGLPDETEKLWKAVIAFEDYPFKTSGRSGREGVKFTAINRIAEKYNMPILYSCHPRSKKRLEQSGFQLDKRVIQHEPLGFHDYNCLQMNAFAVVSDSGTLPEESSFFTSIGHPFPAVCIRTSTERPEALDKACFILAGIDEKNLLQAVDTAVELNRNGEYGIPVPDYLDENVSTKVVKIIQSYTGVVDRMVWRKY